MEAKISTNSCVNKSAEDCMNLGPFLEQYVLSNPFDQSNQTSSKPIFNQITKMPRPKPNILRHGLRPCNAQNKNDRRRQINQLKSKDMILNTSLRIFNSDNYSMSAHNDLDLEEIMTQSSKDLKLKESDPEQIQEMTFKIEPEWNEESISNHLNNVCDFEIKPEIEEESDLEIIKKLSMEKENKVVKNETKNFGKTLNRVTKSAMNLRKRFIKNNSYDLSELNEDDKNNIFDTYLLNDNSDKCLKLLINEFRKINERIDKLESVINKQNDLINW